MPRAVSPMKFPWETNSWLGAVMGVNKDFMSLPTPRPFDLEVGVDVTGGEISTMGTVAKRRRKEIPWQALVDQPRQVALEARLHLLVDYAGSTVGEQMRKKDGKTERIQILRDTVEHKATGTLRIRALDLKRFLGWAERYGREVSPVAQEDCYEYVAWLRQSLAAPTAASRFKEAMTFAHHVMGWPVQEGVLQSKRVMGVGTAMMKGLKQIKRAAPFPPRLVLSWEDIIQDVGQPMETRYYIGVILFQLYSRFRFGDLQGVQQEPWMEQGNLMAEVTEYKTKMAKDRRGTKLPVVAVGQGLHSQSWAVQFQMIRSALGLELPGCGVLFPLLEQGQPTLQALTTGDQTKLVRKYVTRAIAAGVLPPDTDVEQFSSHSCKRTLLHWAAADGLPLDDRRLLGNHVLRSDGSWIAFSIDGLRGPVASLAKTIGKVGRGELVVSGAQIKPKEPSRAEESSTESSESLGEPSSGEETKELARMLPEPEDVGNADAFGDYEIYRHGKYNTFHLRRRKTQQLELRLLCGRVINTNYIEQSGIPTIPRCSTCFAQAGLMSGVA
eukprot:2925024-Amphidinium_carterae.1